MNEYDGKILKELEKKVNFKKFEVATTTNKLNELKKELKKLEKITKRFKKTGILYC